MKKLLQSCTVAALCSLSFLSLPALHAQVPQLLNYQGRVAVGTVNFNGSGQFKFALVDAAGTTTYWSNDGTSTNGSEPAAAVALTVTKGLYSVLLGDTSLGANMTAVPASVFNNADVRLRVWFNDGTTGSQLLTPDQRIAAVGYAMMADGVRDGAITTAKIAAGAVGSAQLAPGTVFSWQSATDSLTAQSNTGYTANAPTQVTVTLPATPAVGDTVRVLGAGGGGWSIAPNAGQSVLGGSAAGTSWTPHGPAKNWFRLASSADGGKFVAAANNEHLYASADGGNSWTELTAAGTRAWNGLASSANGAKLVAAVTGGFIYLSIDSGANWAPRETGENRGWQAVASSADGSKLFAAAPAYGIYASTDLNHNTWTPASGTSAPSWSGLACSADGTKVVAVANGSQIYTSADSGASWSPHGVSAAYKAVASSADGTKLVAVVNGGQIYTSTDSGATWTARDSARAWFGVASSASGANLVAVVYQGQVYTSTDSGATWTARDSIRDWQCAASSADGSSLAAGVDGNDRIYISQQYLTGAQGSTAELQYVGSGQWQAMNQALIAAGAIGTPQLASGAVGSSQIAGGAVGTSQLAGGSVNTSQLADNSVTAGKIGSGQVVKTVNTLSDAVTLAAGSNISITQTAGNTLSIAATGTVSGTANVVHDLTLTGNGGTIALGIANGGVGSAQLASTFGVSGAISAGGFGLPATTSASAGLLALNGTPFLHAFGSGSTFLGSGAGNFTLTGANNTGIGAGALSGNTTGSENTATGSSALGANGSGFFNTASGFQALGLNTTGGENTAIGWKALQLNTTGLYNTASGVFALGSNTTGLANTATGRFALGFNTTASNNTADGFSALNSNTSGFQNTAAGASALFSNTTGSSNSASGYRALRLNTAGAQNTASGESALGSNTTGNNNIAVGSSAGASLTTGNNNIAIGNSGVAGESSIIRIGTPGTQSDTYLTGVIHGNGSGLTNIPASAVVKVPPGMVLIPGGAFTMGNSVAADTDITDAAPISTNVSAFYMDANLVTLSQWRTVYNWAVVQTTYAFSAGSGKAPNHPVQTVTWYDCVKWCNARSEREGKTPVYYTNDAQTAVYRAGNVNVTNLQVKWSANGYRLPTEAEWEKAARGGLSGQRFPWGLAIDQTVANYNGATGSYSYDFGPNGYNAIGNYPTDSVGTSPVGSFAPNGHGLYDMAGNLYEWCWDWYGTPYAGGTDPHGPATVSGRVLRGGAWFDFANFARCADRYFDFPTDASGGIGFRAVLPPGQP